MLKRTNVYLDDKELKKLAQIANKSTPGTTVAQLIRQAITEFVQRQEKK